MKQLVLTNVKALPVTSDDPEVFPAEYLERLLKLPEEQQQQWLKAYLQTYRDIPSFVEDNIKKLGI